MRERALGAVLVGAVVLVGAACGGDDTGTSDTSTTTEWSTITSGTGVTNPRLEGTVVAGPVCGPESDPPDPACAPRPVPGAVIELQTVEGDLVSTITAGPKGEITVQAPPGRYRLVPQPVEGLMGTAEPVEIELPAPASADPLVIGYDTGIR